MKQVQVSQPGDARVALGLRLVIWIWPAFCAGLVFWLTRPGYLSFDSALTYWQARHDQYLDISGPLLPWLWHLLLPLDVGTDAIRGVLMGSVAIGLSACLWAWRDRIDGHRLIVAALLAPLCPPLVMIWPHVWTDVLLVGLLLWLVALWSSDVTGERVKAWRIGVALVLCLAVCCCRHNGWFALPPMLWVLVGTWPWVRVAWRRAACALGLLAALVGCAGAINARLVETKLDTWAVTLMWDLQAVSVATLPDAERSLIPASLTGDQLRVGELREAFDAESATRLFAATRSGVANPVVAPLSAAQRDDLRRAWLAVLGESAYWWHRAHVTRALLGFYESPRSRGLAEAPTVTSYADNPPLPAFSESAHAIFRALIDRGFAWHLFAPGVYFLLALAVLGARWRRLDAIARHDVLLLLASAICYALPLVAIAPSAETRYLLWPVVASWCALLRVAAGSRVSASSNTRR